MKKNIIALSIIAGIGFNNIFTITSSANILDEYSYNNLNHYTNRNNIEKPIDKEKIERFWTKENESFLNESEREILNSLRVKLESGENLTAEERVTLSVMRGETIRKKLGDTRFERYKKLIEKRTKQERGQLEIELTKEEKGEIYNFEKEINGK